MLTFNPQAAQSRVTNEWLSDIHRRYPVQRIMTRDAQGVESWTGNVRSSLVRLSFPHLFKPQPAMEAGKEPQFMVTSLFPAGADISLLALIAQETATAEWGANAASFQLHSPFRDQGEKASKYSGYVPGSTFIASGGQRRPPVVDQNLAPITDENRVYPGVWGFVTYRCFPYNVKGPTGAILKRGISFGLQSVMIVADDENLGGGGSDPNQDFAGVQIEAAVNPAGLFSNHGQVVQQGAPGPVIETGYVAAQPGMQPAVATPQITGYDPATGQPIYAQPAAAAPTPQITGYDPANGQPIYAQPAAAPVQPQIVGYDPATGQPVYG